jgi:outer membrane protein
VKRYMVACLLIAPALCMAAKPEAERGPLHLTLKRAIELALSPEGNARIQYSRELVRQSKARSAEVRASLLPDLEGYVGEQNQVRNLSDQGLHEIQLPFNFQLPSRVGPYDVFDVRATVTQNVLDVSAIRRLQASHAGISAAKADLENVDDQVASQVAKAYLEALRSEAELEATAADVALGEAVLKQAQNQKAAGAGTGIEVTRAKVQLSNEKQRELVAENGRRRARLQLLRSMGLRLDTELDLADKLDYSPTDTSSFDQAQAEAAASRADLKAQEEHQETARLNASATKLERIPSIAAFADYGTTGQGYYSALPTRTYGIALKVPVFDGFRRDARREEAQSILRQEQVHTNDLKDQIDLEIQLALDSLHSAQEQFTVASEGIKLAEAEFTQARRRYEAGVSGSLEVTDAQTRLARARQNQISALFNYNLARLDFGQATGTIRRMLQ